jgi:hypothetical protein
MVRDSDIDSLTADAAQETAAPSVAPDPPTDEERTAFKRQEAEAVRPAFMGPPEGAIQCPMCWHEFTPGEPPSVAPDDERDG